MLALTNNLRLLALLLLDHRDQSAPRHPLHPRGLHCCSEYRFRGRPGIATGMLLHDFDCYTSR
jgi:hypothetical protein